MGDSITAIAARDITAAFDGTYHPTVHAEIGRRIDQMLPALQDAVRTHPWAVVVNLGTNDVAQARTHPDWRSGFDHMIALLAPTRCAVLTTVSTFVRGPTAVPSVASDINAAIASAASAHHNFHVIDWNAYIHRPNGTDLLVADEVHPSPAGQVALGVLTRAALDRDCTTP